MTNLTWPSELPAPSITGYGYKPVSSFIRTTLDSGQTRQRRRFITTPTKVTTKFRLTRVQLATFESWWFGDCQAGTHWFQLPLFNGQGLNQVRARGVDSYQLDAVDDSTDLVDVSLPLETLSLPVA